MLEHLTKLALLVVAVIHLLPAVGVQSGSRLVALYAIEVADPNLLILMRHRAVLFAALGGLCLAAIFLPHLRTAALVCASVSVLAFLVLAHGEPVNEALRRVVVADYVALAALVAAVSAHALKRLSF